MGTKSNIPEAGDRITTVRLPAERHEELKAIADAEQRSFSQQVRWVLERWLDERENGHA